MDLQKCYHIKRDDDMYEWYGLYRELHRLFDHLQDGKYGGENLRYLRAMKPSLMSDEAKVLIRYLIDSHGKSDLMDSFENLSLLKCVKPLKRTLLLSDESYFHMGGMHEWNMVCGLERKGGQRMHKISEFSEYLYELDALLVKRVENGSMDPDERLQIKAIGGFAMLHYGLREHGVTDDIDSLEPITQKIRNCVKMVAQSEKLPSDWLNDLMVSQFGYEPESFHWAETGIKMQMIDVLVCSREDLLRNKIPLAEMYLQDTIMNERNGSIDYQDVMSLLNYFGIIPGVTNSAFVKTRLRYMGVTLTDFPSLNRMLCYDSDPVDTLIFDALFAYEHDAAGVDELITCMERVGLNKEDVMDMYGLCLEFLPKCRSLFVL